MPRTDIINTYILKININCFGAGKWKNCLLVFYVIFIFSSVQFIHSMVSDYLQPNGLQHARLACPSPTPSRGLLKLMTIESVMSSNHLILCHPLLLPPSIFPNVRIFSESVLCIRWPKYWSFSFSISSSNEYSGLTSFRIDWFDLFAVQVTLKSFSNTTVQKHQFFGTRLSLWSI